MMGHRSNGARDEYSEQIRHLLTAKYLPQHPHAKVEAYRYNTVSVRVRVVDADFAGKDTAERDEMVWPILEQLPDKVVQDISVLLLLTPEERTSSFVSEEFDAPSHSTL
jgi:hypothetical protein